MHRATLSESTKEMFEGCSVHFTTPLQSTTGACPIPIWIHSISYMAGNWTKFAAAAAAAIIFLWLLDYFAEAAILASRHNLP